MPGRRSQGWWEGARGLTEETASELDLSGGRERAARSAGLEQPRSRRRQPGTSGGLDSGCVLRGGRRETDQGCAWSFDFAPRRRTLVQLLWEY